MMIEEESATLDSQFLEFARFLDQTRDGLSINLRRSDYWMRQAKLLDDRKLTMTYTGVEFTKYKKVELCYEEWLEFLHTVLQSREIDRESAYDQLVNCGLPGTLTVDLPVYRLYFDTYVPKDKLIF